jgi:hypothetical protein
VYRLALAVLADRFFVRYLPDAFCCRAVHVAVAVGWLLAGPGMEAAENGVKFIGGRSGLHGKSSMPRVKGSVPEERGKMRDFSGSFRHW